MKYLFYAFVITLAGCGSDNGNSSQATSGGSNDSTVNTANLPLLSDLNNLQYLGAFKMFGGVVGSSKLNNSQAIFDIKIDSVNPANSSLFITSHVGSLTCVVANPATHTHSVAELPVPALVNSINLVDLNTVTSLEFKQPFVNLLNFARIPKLSVNHSNPLLPNADCMDRITGIKYFNGSLILNTMEYYDGQNNDVDTTLLVENASNLTSSPVHGFFQVAGAANTSRWISEVPSEWQSALGGNYIFGNANNYPRNGRQSYGPSAYVVDLNSFVPNPVDTAVSSIKLIDYTVTSIKNRTYAGTGLFVGSLHEDFYNISGTNKLWTEKSKPVYGFIVPGTSTYLAIGSSGGYNSRVCYKTTNSSAIAAFNAGTDATLDTGCAIIDSPAYIAQYGKCGGYCLTNPNDVYNFYWLYDVKDMIKVKKGQLLPQDMRPYATGQISMPFQQNLQGNPEFHAIASASFDAASSTLYMSLQRAGEGFQNNNRAPVIVAYKIK